MKDAFFQDLESILAAIPTGEKYVILGDFNARMGSRKCVGDRWGSVRGPHGYEVIDDGKELLSFLSVHRAMLCEENHTPTDMAASEVQAVELH